MALTPAQRDAVMDYGIMTQSACFIRIERTSMSLRRFVAIILFGLTIMALLSRISSARAADEHCNAPPYGDTWGAYHAYIENFGAYVDPAKLLPPICEGKFHEGQRTVYYKLGISPQDFATKSVTDLAVEILVTIRKLARQTSSSVATPDIAPGILYAPYTCSRSAGVCDPPTDPSYVFSTMRDCHHYIAMLGSLKGAIYMECLSISSALPWPLPEISAGQAPMPPARAVSAPTATEIQPAAKIRKSERLAQKQAEKSRENAYRHCRVASHFNPLVLFGAINLCPKP